MTVELTTIKEKLLADIRANSDHRGRCSLSPEELAKRHGLNGHDLAKNLDQMKKEGLIHDPWAAPNRLGRIRLRGVRPEILSGQPVLYRDRIIDWIRSQPGADLGAWVQLPEGWRSLTAGMKVADGKADSVAVTASKLAIDGVIEAKRDGRRVRAVRVPLNGKPPIVVIDEKTATVSTSEPMQHKYAMPATPNLDAYVSARRIARLAPAHNPYLSIEFSENPIAEEAIALRELIHRLRSER